MVQINIAGPTYTHPSLATNNQRCLNLYTLAPGPEGRGKGTLMQRAGITSIADTGLQSIRAMIAVDNIIYGVADNKFFKCVVDVSFRTSTLSIKGTLNTFTGRVELSANRAQVMVVNGTSTGYIYDINADTFTAIADNDFLGGSTVTFMDGYFIYSPVGTQKINNSAINDGTNWDALDTAEAEYKNDIIVKLITKKRELWVFGAASVEVWYDAANQSGSPFSPRIGSEIAIGCRSGASVVEINDTLIWLDNRGFIVAGQTSDQLTNTTSGHAAAILSTDAVNTAIATYEDTANAIGAGFVERGHQMYQITFPLDQKTWVFDLTTGQWHERSFFNVGQGTHQAVLTQYCVSANGLNIGAGGATGLLYILHPDYKDDNGEYIRAIRTTAPLNQEFKLLEISQLELRCNSGYANQSGVGSNPHILMRYSNDTGRTWSNEIAQPLGDVGQYSKRISWNRLGTAAEWMFEFTIVEPIDFAIVDAVINPDVENF